jgi:DNA-binding CsgD family transcriptional regulator
VSELIVDRWVAAYNAHDVDALVDLADPRIEIAPFGYTVMAPPGTSYHGYDGVRSLLAPGFQRYPRLRMERRDEAVVGRSTIGPATLVLDDGEAPPVRRTGAMLFVLDAERVRRLRSFPTEAEAHAAAARGYGALTPREREILYMLAEGLTAKQVADRLFLSVLTVRTHIRNAKPRLRARTTAHAIAIALEESETGMPAFSAPAPPREPRSGVVRRRRSARPR